MLTITFGVAFGILLAVAVPFLLLAVLAALCAVMTGVARTFDACLSWRPPTPRHAARALVAGGLAVVTILGRSVALLLGLLLPYGILISLLGVDIGVVVYLVLLAAGFVAFAVWLFIPGRRRMWFEERRS